jgi:hypothetical protein
MAKFIQNEKGEVFEDLGNGYVRPASMEEAQAGKKNPLESFGESIGLSAISAVKGAQKLLQHHPDYMAGGQPDRDLQIARNLQQANTRQNPISSFAGEVVPAGLVAAGTAGWGVPAVIGTEAALGAAYAPENPFLGAAVGAGAAGLGAAAGPYAGRMADRVLGRLKGVEDDALRAKQNAQFDDRAIDMPAFVREAESLDLKVPMSVKHEAQWMENLGLTLESSPLTSWMTGGPAKHNMAVLDRTVKDAVGLPQNASLTPLAIREAENASRSQFEALGAFGTKESSKDALRKVVIDNLEDSFVGRQKFIKQVDALLKDYSGDSLTGRELISFQSNLGDLARKAKGEKQLAISKARDAVIDSIPSSEAAGQQFQKVREQWAAQRALLDSIGQRGAVSPAKLAKRITSRNEGSAIGKLGRTAEAMSFMRPSSYGTENARRGGLTGTVATGALGGYGLSQGYDALFGN